MFWLPEGKWTVTASFKNDDHDFHKKKLWFKQHKFGRETQSFDRKQEM